VATNRQTTLEELLEVILWDSKARMTVQAGASSNLPDWQQFT
jgi:hypothetical protein